MSPTTRKFANVAATGVASLVIDDVADPVNEADAALTVEALPMSKWWDLDLYPVS